MLEHLLYGDPVPNIDSYINKLQWMATINQQDRQIHLNAGKTREKWNCHILLSRVTKYKYELKNIERKMQLQSHHKQSLASEWNKLHVPIYNIRCWEKLKWKHGTFACFAIWLVCVVRWPVAGHGSRLPTAHYTDWLQ